VTFTQAVPDSQVYSMNLEWFNGLPADVQEGIEFAGEITAQQNLPRFPSARSYAMSELIAKSGVEFHSLSDDQLANGRTPAATSAANGTVQGGPCRFDGHLRALEEAAGTMGRYYVHDA
jgi:TRAP-type C4-dicarboxylate transport system substrate-binding protein